MKTITEAGWSSSITTRRRDLLEPGVFSFLPRSSGGKRCGDVGLRHGSRGVAGQRIDGRRVLTPAILPRQEMACGDFLEILLSDGCLRHAPVYEPLVISATGISDQNMRSAEVRRREFAAMEELAARYGSPSQLFTAGISPDETGIAGHFEEEFIDYLNAYCRRVKALNPAYKTLIAPYGTRSAAWVMALCAQLERLEVDYIAYQDEVGGAQTQVEELPGIYERLNAHDQVGRSRLWADVGGFPV